GHLSHHHGTAGRGGAALAQIVRSAFLHDRFPRSWDFRAAFIPLRRVGWAQAGALRLQTLETIVRRAPHGGDILHRCPWWARRTRGFPSGEAVAPRLCPPYAASDG